MSRLKSRVPHIEAWWTPDREEETHVHLSPDIFNNDDWLTQCDFLGDVIGELQKKYDSIMQRVAHRHIEKEKGK